MVPFVVGSVVAVTVMRELLFVLDVIMLRECEGDGNAGVGDGGGIVAVSGGICVLYKLIKGFGRKLSLFERGNFSYFQCFILFCAGFAEEVNLKFWKKIIHDLDKHF